MREAVCCTSRSLFTSLCWVIKKKSSITLANNISNSICLASNLILQSIIMEKRVVLLLKYRPWLNLGVLFKLFKLSAWKQIAYLLLFSSGEKYNGEHLPFKAFFPKGSKILQMECFICNLDLSGLTVMTLVWFMWLSESCLCVLFLTYSWLLFS